MKILICGGLGQLGSDCTVVLKRSHDVVSLSSRELDITDPDDVDAAVKKVAPDVVLNCAGFTKVDECETKKDLAWKVNVEGPANLAAGAGKHNCFLVHISTDYVFDGKRKPPEPYVEGDSENPLSYYGRTKWEGERAVEAVSGSHIILRTAWLYGIRGSNFLKTMLKLALNAPEREIKVVNDQFGSPTWSYTLALQIQNMIEAGGQQGIYHATSEGYCSWYDLAHYFLVKMNVPQALAPCTTEEYPTPATRPGNSILENRRLKDASLQVMQEWKEDLDRFVSLYGERLVNEELVS